MTDNSDIDLVVTRHEGLVGFLLEEGVIDEGVPRKEHVESDDVRDRKVVGNLPTHLAAEADEVTEVMLEYPEDYRGEELSADQVREFSSGLATYKVDKIR